MENKKHTAYIYTAFFILIHFASLFAVTGAQVAIYNGPGTWADGIVSFEKFCDWKGITHEQVTPNDVNTIQLKDYYQGIFMPGGDAYYYKLAINASGLQHIRDLVNLGGFYMGMCAGSYFACDSIEWEGGIYDYQLELFNGFARGAIDAIDPWPNYTMTNVTMNMNNPINAYSSGHETILYYGGPVYEPKPAQAMDTIATWDSWYNLPAIVNFTYGNGRVLFSGPHPETEEDSNRDGTTFGDSLNDNGSDWPFLWSAVDWVMKNPISNPHFWINEFHYDDQGADNNEFVEIVVPYNFTDFSNLTLSLYDGATGQVYGSYTADTFTQGAVQDSFLLLSVAIPGIQDGPDGFCLDYKGNVIQFLSYEGSFTAIAGPANGLTSTDIGVFEDGTDPDGNALQLSGTGTIYREFTWSAPSPQTAGQVNSNAQIDQTLPVNLTSFTATDSSGSVVLEWTTASEIANSGFILERKTEQDADFYEIANYADVKALRGAGYSSAAHSYRYIDKPGKGRFEYRIKDADYAGRVTVLATRQVEISNPVATDFLLLSNYPNPFNPGTRIRYTLPEDSRIQLDVFDAGGHKIRTLFNGFQKQGVHHIAFDAQGLASGVYFYRLQTKTQVLTKKMLLVR